MKDYGVTYFILGIEIHRDRSLIILGLSQKAWSYVEVIKYGNYSPSEAPISKWIA